MKTFKQFQEQVVPKNSSERTPYPYSYSGTLPYIRTKDVLERGAIDFFSKYFMGPDFKQVKRNKFKDKTKIATHDRKLFKTPPATGPAADVIAGPNYKNAAGVGGGSVKSGTGSNPFGIRGV